MTEQGKKNTGKIKDNIGAASTPGKKKIVIKKQSKPKNKDISDLFNKDAGSAKSSGGVRKVPGGERSGVSSDRKNIRPQAGDQAQRSNKTLNVGQQTGADVVRPAGKRPDVRPGGPGRSHPPQSRVPGQERPQARTGGRKDNSTPFDNMLETTNKSAAAGGGGRPVRQGHHKKTTPAEQEKGAKKGKRGNDSENKFFKTERRKTTPLSGTTVPKSIEIMESIQVGELAKKLNLKPGDVISKLMKMGEMVTINKTIDADTATLLATEYGCETKVVSLYDGTLIEEETDDSSLHVKRPPVVTIMGHVDHGKTKLLDTIRKSNVIDTEAGAITQHIGAYQVNIPQGKITFLDTPGHEAFTAMRARGAAVTDIVVIVVAADDGVKDQTLEAITHAKEADIPIIVAVNKIDLPAANVDKVKQELSGHGLQPEEWGGTTIFCEISAKENIGIDHLLEMILLQADVLELKANAGLRAVGRVVEAKIDPGKGPVATVLVQKGTLSEGDPYVVGVFSGRVRTLLDDLGHRIEKAGPATPVEITGIDGVPLAGDPFQVVESEKYGREIADKRQHYKQITDAVERVQPSLGDLQSWISDHKELKIIIKADVQGSVEAIKDGLLKLSTDDVKVRVIYAATGAISESDVTLASASNALIIGFQVRATPRASDLAESNHVEIKYYSIIYEVIEEVHAAMEGMLEPDKVEEITGRVEVRQIFKISRIGIVAGCMVIKGKIKKSHKLRVIRNSVVVYTGSLKSLRREKDEVQEINEGFECGMSVDGYNDIQVGDIFEFFEIKEVARKLNG